jgi:hypothetical protein
MDNLQHRFPSGVGWHLPASPFGCSDDSVQSAVERFCSSLCSLRSPCRTTRAGRQSVTCVQNLIDVVAPLAVALAPHHSRLGLRWQRRIDDADVTELVCAGSASLESKVCYMLVMGTGKHAGWLHRHRIASVKEELSATVCPDFCQAVERKTRATGPKPRSRINASPVLVPCLQRTSCNYAWRALHT